MDDGEAFQNKDVRNRALVFIAEQGRARDGIAGRCQILCEWTEGFPLAPAQPERP